MLKSHTLTLTLSHTFNLSFTHSRYAEQLLFSCLCSKVTLSLFFTLTLSISHSLTLDMLNKFCFHLYAQKSLFIGENCKKNNLTSSSSATPSPVSFEFIELVLGHHNRTILTNRLLAVSDMSLPVVTAVTSSYAATSSSRW